MTSHPEQIAEVMGTLSEEQGVVITSIIEDINNQHKITALLGSAGTGKSVTAAALSEVLEITGRKYEMAAPTHRAASVLREKSGRPVKTLHQASMKPRFKKPMQDLMNWANEGFSGHAPGSSCVEWPGLYDIEGLTPDHDIVKMLDITLSDYITKWVPADYKGGTLIVDEASMVCAEQLDCAFKVFDTLVMVGDPNQLPPVKGEPVWDIIPAERQHTLKQVFRQADGSPIIDIAAKARETGRIVASIDNYTATHARNGVPLICWRNKTRRDRTLAIREMLGYGTDIEVGEPIVCKSSRKTDQADGLFNNSLWTVTAVDGDMVELTGDSGIVVNRKLAMDEFDETVGVPCQFGYAITCHTSQGSEWPVVAIDKQDADAHYSVNEKMMHDDARKWAYTAVTRAKSELFMGVMS